MIQEVEELGPKIHLQTLIHRSHLGQGKVYSRKARPDESIPAQVAVKTCRRKLEHRRIKIPVRSSQNRAVAGPGLQVRPIRDVPGQISGPIKTRLGSKRRAGLDRDDPAQLPASQHAAGQPMKQEKHQPGNADGP